MALIANVQKEYAYQIQDLGSLLEQINTSPTTDVRDRAIAAAVAYYTRRLPRLQVALVASIPGGFYPVPADWVDHSRIVALEFPINGTPPIYYSPKAWQMHPREADGLYYYPDPNPGGQFRLIYIAAHGATVALPMESLVGSIPTSHEALIGMIAAEIACREFSQRYAGSVMANVDSVNYRGKSNEFTKAADALKLQYDQEMTRAELAALKRGDPYTYFKGWAV